MSEMNEVSTAAVTEYTVLSKFEGPAEPENLVEQIHIVDGEIVQVDKIEDGEVISSEIVKEVE